MSIKIKINNQETETRATHVHGLAMELGLPERGVALAVNNAVVPRDAWADTALAEGDDVTVIKAAFGG